MPVPVACGSAVALSGARIETRRSRVLIREPPPYSGYQMPYAVMVSKLSR